MADKFNFFNDHSERYIEMAFCSDYFETLSDPDGYGKSASDCGDTIEVYLSVANNRVDSISFRIEGCMNTRACANAMAHMITGSSIGEAWALRPQRIIDFLETLPPASHHCAELACSALHQALANFRTNVRDPWKKNYIFK